jgi:hypothetical protein
LPSCIATQPVFNATFDSVEGRWKAIQLGEIFRDKGYYQAAFHARLALKLSEMGYGIKKDGNSFSAGRDRARDGREILAAHRRHRGRSGKDWGLPTKPRKHSLGVRRARRKARTRSHVGAARGMGQPPDAGERLAIKTHGTGTGPKGDDAITPEQAKEYRAGAFVSEFLRRVRETASKPRR